MSTTTSIEAPSAYHGSVDGADWQRANDYPIEFMTEVSLNIAQDDELLKLIAK